MRNFFGVKWAVVATLVFLASGAYAVTIPAGATLCRGGINILNGACNLARIDCEDKVVEGVDSVCNGHNLSDIIAVMKSADFKVLNCGYLAETDHKQGFEFCYFVK